MSEELLARLPQNIRRIAEICGVENALKIAREFSGTRLDIPKLDNLYREIRDQAIREEYDAGGTTVVALALKHSLTERQMYNILGCQPDKTPPELPLGF